MEKLTKGDIVGVFGKPLTQEKFEGKAKLIRFVSKVSGCDRTENWMVCFEGDKPDDVYPRVITY